jgi:hypothetical protein
VRVPDEAVKGNAKVTLSFSDWKEGKVAPARFEIPIIEPEKDEAKPARAESGEKKPQSDKQLDQPKKN